MLALRDKMVKRDGKEVEPEAGAQVEGATHSDFMLPAATPTTTHLPQLPYDGHSCSKTCLQCSPSTAPKQVELMDDRPTKNTTIKAYTMPQKRPMQSRRSPYTRPFHTLH